jgi:hypothetical protein
MRSNPNKAHLWKEASHPKITLVNKHVASLYFFECVWIYGVKVLQYVLWNRSNTLLSPQPSGAILLFLLDDAHVRSKITCRCIGQMAICICSIHHVCQCPKSKIRWKARSIGCWSPAYDLRFVGLAGHQGFIML